MFIVQECVFLGVIHTVWRFKCASYAYTQTINYDKPKDALQFCTENYYFDILIDEKTSCGLQIVYHSALLWFFSSKIGVFN